MTRVRSLGGAEEELVVVIGLSGDLSIGFVVAGAWFGCVVVVVGFGIAVVVGFVVAGLGVVVASIAGFSRGRIVICVGSIWNVLSSILFECMNGMFVVYLV